MQFLIRQWGILIMLLLNADNSQAPHNPLSRRREGAKTQNGCRGTSHHHTQLASPHFALLEQLVYAKNCALELAKVTDGQLGAVSQLLKGGPISSRRGSTPAELATGKDAIQKPNAEGARPTPAMAASALVEPGHQNGAAAQGQGSTQQTKSSDHPSCSAPQAEAEMPLAGGGNANGHADQKRFEAAAISKTSAAPSVSLTASGQTQNGKQHNKTTTAAAPQPAVVEALAKQPQQATGEASSQPTAQSEPAAAPANPTLTREAAIERLEGLLRRLSAEHDPEGFFREAVSVELKGCEDYYDRISRPMWLSRISTQLKHGHYRTLNQLQADLELVCSNALSFNQKISKVYKNAQALSKASKKQFQIERSLLLEAIAVLHPGGLEAARKDQAEEEKSLKFAPPPKKPAKPSKPPKKPPTLTGGSSHVGGSGNYANLISSPSSGNLAAYVDAQRSLPTLGEAEDLLVDVHTLENEGYSSYSDSEGEKPGRKQTDRMGAHTEAQPWKRDQIAATPAGMQAAAASSGQPNAWKSRRRCTEWRVRWLELRLRELKYQQTRYEHMLQLAQNPEAAVCGLSGGQPSASALPPQPSSSHAEGPSTLKGKALGAQDFRTPEAIAKEQKLGTVQASSAWMRAGDNEPPRKKQRKQRQVVRELGWEQLLDHPFFAAEAGFRKNKQVVKEAEDADVSDDDINYPARVFAATELLERHCLGLRELLCQSEPESRLPGKQPFKGGGRGRSSAVRGRTKGKSSARYRRNQQEGVSSGFLVHGLPSQTLDLGKPVKDILIPKYREHSLEELQVRAELLAAYEARAAAGRKGKEQKSKSAAEAGGPSVQKDVNMDAESSSSEDTSDEAFARTHTIEEERERAKYEGEATKKKRNKSKLHNNTTEGAPPQVVLQQATVAPAAAGAGLVPTQLAAVKTHPETTDADGQAGSPTSEPGSPCTGLKDGKKGRPAGVAGRGRGGRRGRGRPPNPARGAVLLPLQKARHGPGRGHKGVKAAGPDLLNTSATAPAAVAAVGTGAGCPPVALGTQEMAPQHSDAVAPGANGSADKAQKESMEVEESTPQEAKEAANDEPKKSEKAI